LQRQPIEEEEEELQRQPIEEEEEELQRQPIEEEEEELQAKMTSGHIPEIQPDIESHIQSLKGGGQPLSANDRAFFEPRFGYDFGQVRVHTHSRAAESARAVNARAFAIGSDIVFGAGQYSPETVVGKRFLAHELTHVVQQSKTNVRILMRDFERTSSTGDRLLVITDTVDPTGAVRHWAAPMIITASGDSIRYQCEVEVPRTHTPFNVIVGVRNIAVGGSIVQHQFNSIRLPHWRQANLLHIPSHTEPTTMVEANEFFVRLEPRGAQILVGMQAIAHVIQNRVNAGEPRGQVDTSPWPRNFINTGYLLPGVRELVPWPHWPSVTSTASRLLARTIIREERAAGTDPTFGALYYRSAGTPNIEFAVPTFIRLRELVERGVLRRVTVGGNVFYAPI
jgi:hypothetical protein